jgi:hypothetical protein
MIAITPPSVVDSRIKQWQIAGEGENVTLGISNPMEHMMTATNAVHVHVPENRGTCPVES